MRRVVCAVLMLAGCSDTIPLDGGMDVPSGLEGGVDAPAGDDAPGPDAPLLDAPGIDSPAIDAPVTGPPAPEGCFTDVTAGHHAFDCDGIRYDVEISTACAAGGCGLIFDVHGATMNAASEDANTNLRALGSAAGYVVVQPTAPPGTLGPSWDPVRDDPLVFAFLQLTMRAMRIDPDRVHFTGFSQGGFMTWRMLCQHADLFASVAPAAACGTLFPHCAFSATERPSREVPVLYVHGRGDVIVGGCMAGQRDAVVAGWSMTMDTIVSMDANHTWTRWRSTAGTPFELIDHDWSAFSTILRGHCLPGSTDIGTDRFGITGYGCLDSDVVRWGESALAFFVAHPRG
jgi:pimeloyl-ACP methyl ester carboxylesterase